MGMTSYGAEAYLNVYKYNNYMRYIFVYIYMRIRTY